jgi:crossover junction endodeoxyribonuclease RuvC
MLVVAVDPGTRGALAALSGSEVVLVDDLPTHTLTARGRGPRNELDVHSLHTIIAGLGPIEHCFLERVGPMPRQGLGSTWRFAYSAGSLYGLVIALGLPVSFVLPRAWQTHHHIGPTPDASRQRACQLFPEVAPRLCRKRDNHRSDALLLASFGVHVLRPERARAA